MHCAFARESSRAHVVYRVGQDCKFQHHTLVIGLLKQGKSRGGEMSGSQPWQDMGFRAKVSVCLLPAAPVDKQDNVGLGTGQTKGAEVTGPPVSRVPTAWKRACWEIRLWVLSEDWVRQADWSSSPPGDSLPPLLAL